MCSWLRLLVIEREREIERVECVPLNERRAHGSDTTRQKPEIPDLVKPNRYLRHHQSSFDSEQLKKQRYNFGKYFEAHDNRRGTSFKRTFPELADFFEECKRIKL